MNGLGTSLDNNDDDDGTRSSGTNGRQRGGKPREFARPRFSGVNVTIYINLSLRNPPADRYEKIDSAGSGAAAEHQCRRYATLGAAKPRGNLFDGNISNSGTENEWFQSDGHTLLLSYLYLTLILEDCFFVMEL